jgi:GGDEF domain-containing protein
VTAYEEVKSYLQKVVEDAKKRNLRYVIVYYRDVAKALNDKYSHPAVSIALRRACKEIGGDYFRGVCIVTTE